MILELWSLNDEKAHKGLIVKCRVNSKAKCSKTRRSWLSLSN